MGKVFSMLTRPIKNYNLESRAHKIISKDKPTPAPRHKTHVNEAEILLRENPQSLTELMQKDDKLDQHLKDVFVKSHDPEAKKLHPDDGRGLPLNRRPVEAFEFGFLEPEVIPVGRCSLRQACKFLANHQADPVGWNKVKIATEFNLQEEKVGKILQYFRVYQVFFPEKDAKFMFATPSVPKKPLTDNKSKFIDSEKTSDK